MMVRLASLSLLLTVGAYSAGCTTQGTVFQEDGGPLADVDADQGVADAAPSADLAADKAVSVDTAASGDTAAPKVDTAPVLPDAPAAMPDAKLPDKIADTRPADTSPATVPPLPTMVPLPVHPSCTYGRQTIRHYPPEVVLVLDRSGSMLSKVPMTDYSAWDAINVALETTVKNTSSSVAWGLKYFPTTTGCNIADGVDVTPALNNGDKLFTSIKKATPVITGDGLPGTPLQAGVRAATTYLTSRRVPNPQFMIVASDGLPTCPAGVEGDKDSLAAVTEARAKGVSTFIMGSPGGSKAADKLLDGMAAAGGQAKDTVPRYFTVATKDNLLAAMENITTRVAKCVFVFDVAPPSPKDVGLYVDGRRVPATDWAYGPNFLSLEVKGASCDVLKAAQAPRVEMILGCPGVPVP